MVKLNVDFWHVLDPEGDPIDLHSLLSPLKKTPATKRLLSRDSEHSDYLEIMSDSHGQIFGAVSRVRMTGLPGRFDLKTAKHRELEIGEDEGIDEVSFFVYDAGLHVMTTQRHRLVRASKIETVITDLTHQTIELQPVLRKDKWARFEKMEKLGSFNLKLRGPAHHPDFSAEMESLSKLLSDAQTQANAHTFELTMTAGRRREESLNTSLLKKLMRRIRAADDNIESLKIKGRGEGRTRQEEIDFIRDRLVFSAATEYQGRILGAEACQRTLRRAIEDQRDYLKSLL